MGSLCLSRLKVQETNLVPQEEIEHVVAVVSGYLLSYS